MPATSMPLRDLALILVICVVWGGNFVAAAQGMQHFSGCWYRFCGCRHPASGLA
jgi:hypothetical protein